MTCVENFCHSECYPLSTDWVGVLPMMFGRQAALKFRFLWLWWVVGDGCWRDDDESAEIGFRLLEMHSLALFAI